MEHVQESATTAAAAEFRSLFDDPSRLRAWLAEALPSVYGFVFARCGANRAAAEDITQETMVEVVRHRSDFDGRANPMTWVFGIARHKVADHYRAAYREERRRLRVIEGVAEADRGAWGTQEARDVVLDVLHRLPEAQRVVLAFHYLDGFAIREIASRMGRSESAVESLLARGRDGFRRAWNEQQGDMT